MPENLFQRAYSRATGGIGILGRYGLKQERELTDQLIDSVRNDEDLAGLDSFLDLGQTKMTREQHAAYRAGLRERASTQKTAAEGFGILEQQLSMINPLSDSDNEQLAIFKTRLDLAQRYTRSSNPQLQASGLSELTAIAKELSGFSATNEAQQLQAETAAAAIGNERWSRFTSLQDDYRAESSDFLLQRAAFGRVKAALVEPSAAGDLALVFNYMKILDPNSVVRESEFANAQNAGGVPSIVLTAYNRLLRDGERLTPEQREDFYRQAVNGFQQSKAEQAERNSRYLDQGRAADLPDGLLGTFELPIDSPGTEPTFFGIDPLANSERPPSQQPPSRLDANPTSTAPDAPAYSAGRAVADSSARLSRQSYDFVRGFLGFTTEQSPQRFPSRGTIERPRPAGAPDDGGLYRLNTDEYQP